MVRDLQTNTKIGRVIRDWCLVAFTAAVTLAMYSALAPVAISWFQKVRSARVQRPEVVTGEVVSIAGVTFAGAPQTIILLTSPSCQYCLTSAGFHGKLWAQARNARVPFYVFVPSVKAAQHYLQTVGLTGPVKTWEDLSFGFHGTPTIIFLDSRGAVRASLVGRLPERAEGQVLSLVGHPEEMDGAIGWVGKDAISTEELVQLRTKREVSFLDVRERDEFRIWHNENAINIPLFEFDIRAPFELSGSALEVIDCSQFSSQTCASIVARVRQRGFEAVAFSNGLTYKSCDVSRNGT
jgi:hypothetical protein